MPRPRRILMVLDHPFPPDARVENEARSLVEAGFEVTVLSVAPDDRPDVDEHRGIRVVRDRLSMQARNKMRGLAGTLPILTWYLARRIRQAHREWPFDALHVHDLYLFGGGLRAARKLGVPVVGDLHENWVEALKHYAWSTRFPGKLVVSIPRWERVERRWVNAVDRLVVVIEEAAQRNEALGVDPGRITVVPNTVMQQDFEGFEIDEALVASLQEHPTLVYTGAMDVHRGLSSVLQAMPAVLERHPTARLVLVGDGRIRPELEEEARALGIEEAVRFEGWQPQSMLKSYILGAAVCLIPHLKTVHTDNTIPHKLFHYMYLDRPVVTSNCDPLERIVTAERCGKVYTAGDPDDLARAVTWLLDHPGEAQEMAQRGAQAVRERYNWETTVGGLVYTYRELLSAS